MTIIHVSTPNSWRGGEQQLAYLAEELKKHGVKQVIICPGGSPLEAHCKEKGYETIPFKKKGMLKIGLARIIAKSTKIASQALIHVHDSHAHTAAVMASAFLGNNAPIVLSRRVDFPVKKNIFSYWKYNHPSINRILCVSEKIKEITSKSIRDKSKLVTIHSGIDLSKFDNKAPKNILREEYGIPLSTKIIGNVAALADHKDYYTFVDTAQIIIKENKIPCKFFIIGDGPLKDEIKSYIKHKGLENDVLMTGFRKDIPQILPGLDIFLITSKTEGLGTSVLDAFACKVLVIATKAGGIPEMVKHEETGMLSGVKDAEGLARNIQKILQDDELREELRKKAFLIVEKFKKENTARKTIEVYKDIWA